MGEYALSVEFKCWASTGTLACILLASTALAQEMPALTSEDGTPICSAASFDPDGDGWGWENHRSCIVQTSGNSQVASDNSPNTLPTCSNASTDPDGDGYGWENNRSCVVAETQSQFPQCSSSDFDSDGDGWGWENDRSCVVTFSKKSTATNSPQQSLPNCSNASTCLLYTSPSPRDATLSRMPSSA